MIAVIVYSILVLYLPIFILTLNQKIFGSISDNHFCTASTLNRLYIYSESWYVL